MPVSGVASGTAEEEAGEVGEEGEEELLSTQTMVANAARCEMRVTRQRTKSPADKEEEALSAALLAAVCLTTETSGRCCFVLVGGGESEKVELNNVKGDEITTFFSFSLSLTCPDDEASSTFTLPTSDETTEPAQRCVPGPGAWVV